jgi:hypothetical protein
MPYGLLTALLYLRPDNDYRLNPSLLSYWGLLNFLFDEFSRRHYYRSHNTKSLLVLVKGMGGHLSIIAHGFTIGSWSPGIGDPSWMGWFTVYSYYLTAGVYLLKLIRERRHKPEWIFLGIICFGMILLGVIKQFNLLSAVTEIGRIIAQSGTWMEQRRFVQIWAMAGVICVFIITVIIICALPMEVVAHNRMTILGFAYLVLFIILRGISLHQFGNILGYEILGARINWLAELLGIYWVCFSSLWKTTMSV